MTSWRDTASESSQADLDGLLNSAIELASTTLTTTGAFVPFAVTTAEDGETSIAMVEAHGDAPETDRADIDSPAHIEHLVGALREQRDQLRAVAIVSNVRLKSQATDAIAIELEHAEGAVMAAVLPYSRKRFSKKLEYGTLQGMESDSRVWSN